MACEFDGHKLFKKMPTNLAGGWGPARIPSVVRRHLRTWR